MKEVKKKWGKEIWLVNELEYCAKLLIIEPGHECSYHCHLIKKETFYCLWGETQIFCEGEYIVLNQTTEPFTILAGLYHSFSGNYPLNILLEVSTHHDNNDVVRKKRSI